MMEELGQMKLKAKTLKKIRCRQTGERRSLVGMESIVSQILPGAAQPFTLSEVGSRCNSSSNTPYQGILK